MTRNEFIAGLKAALQGELDGASIQNHVDYYNEYILSELQKGRSEEEVTDELGDPWAIAKNLLQMESTSEYDYDDGSSVSSESNNAKENSARVHILGLDSWWKKLTLILGIIGIVMLVVAVIGGLISLLLPFVIPIAIISFVLKILREWKKK